MAYYTTHVDRLCAVTLVTMGIGYFVLRKMYGVFMRDSAAGWRPAGWSGPASATSVDDTAM